MIAVAQFSVEHLRIAMVFPAGKSWPPLAGSSVRRVIAPSRCPRCTARRAGDRPGCSCPRPCHRSHGRQARVMQCTRRRRSSRRGMQPSCTSEPSSPAPGARTTSTTLGLRDVRRGCALHHQRDARIPCARRAGAEVRPEGALCSETLAVGRHWRLAVLLQHACARYAIGATGSRIPDCRS